MYVPRIQDVALIEAMDSISAGDRVEQYFATGHRTLAPPAIFGRSQMSVDAMLNMANGGGAPSAPRDVPDESG